jgi:hypothetical protein
MERLKSGDQGGRSRMTSQQPFECYQRPTMAVSATMATNLWLLLHPEQYQKE